MSAIVLVVAVADNGVIGNAGSLPWRIPEDLKRFKALTLGKPVIMGRKTWDSLPRKPLPGRTNIVVTRFPHNHNLEGAKYAYDFNDAIRIAREETASDVMIIGGAAIFEAALPRATRIELTEVHGNVEGDTFMPAFDRGIWRETMRDGPHQAGELRYDFVTLVRR